MRDGSLIIQKSASLAILSQWLPDFLGKSFDDKVNPAIIVGHSNKAHKFQNVVTWSGGRRLIVGPGSNDASSINARVVANLDVKATNNPTLEQRLIYDDEEAWTAADLNGPSATPARGCARSSLDAPGGFYHPVPLAFDALKGHRHTPSPTPQLSLLFANADHGTAAQPSRRHRDPTAEPREGEGRGA